MVLNELHDPVRPPPPKPPPRPPINWSDKLSGAQKAADILSNLMRAGTAMWNAYQFANRMGELRGGGFARPIPWVRPLPAIEVC
jgi:hypothetical protein